MMNTGGLLVDKQSYQVNLSLKKNGFSVRNEMEIILFSFSPLIPSLL